jgi:phage recombination protein Bet
MSKTDVQVVQSVGLISFTEDQIALIKRQVAPKATTDELSLFLYQAKKTGLDPLTKQIHCIHRYTKEGPKMTIQTGIDGFRVIAERSGLYAGQDEPEWLYDKNSKGEDEILCAKVRIYKFNEKNGQRYQAAVGVAFWDEYCVFDKEGNPTAMWAKMPHNQLAKVAEALALRKAFPQDLSGIYSNVEMEQADNVETTTINVPESLDELREKFLKIWIEFKELVGDKRADPVHFDNWKVEHNKHNFVLAIEHLQQKLDEEKRNSQ